jgi:hypothetical protein
MERTLAREAMNNPPDRIDQCDRCHAEPVEVWDDEDSSGEGDWRYCNRCLRFYAGITRKVGSWRVNADDHVVGAA